MTSIRILILKIYKKIFLNLNIDSKKNKILKEINFIICSILTLFSKMNIE